MKLGRKLALSSVTATLQFLCLGGVALWGPPVVEGIGAHAANLSLSNSAKASTGVADVNVRVGQTSTASKSIAE